MKMQLLTNQEFKHYVRFQNDDLDLMALSTSHHNHEIGLLRNDWLSYGAFSEYYGITETYARIVIKEGRKLQEDYVRYIKSY